MLTKDLTFSAKLSLMLTDFMVYVPPFIVTMVLYTIGFQIARKLRGLLSDPIHAIIQFMTALAAARRKAQERRKRMTFLP